MDTDNLVKMANRIGEFFQAMPDADEARDGVATHLRKFWEPRMRRALYDHVDAGGGTDLLPIVMQALQAQRAALEPVSRPSAA